MSWGLAITGGPALGGPSSRNRVSPPKASVSIAAYRKPIRQSLPYFARIRTCPSATAAGSFR